MVRFYGIQFVMVMLITISTFLFSCPVFAMSLLSNDEMQGIEGSGVLTAKKCWAQAEPCSSVGCNYSPCIGCALSAFSHFKCNNTNDDDKRCGIDVTYQEGENCGLAFTGGTCHWLFKICQQDENSVLTETPCARRVHLDGSTKCGT
ncbi:MAG: hypothetical protein ACYC7E_09550 [Armatimonadota bacterium]